MTSFDEALRALALPGFSAFLLQVEEVRWVGGFAAATWLRGDAVRGR